VVRPAIAQGKALSACLPSVVGYLFFWVKATAWLIERCRALFAKKTKHAFRTIDECETTAI